MSKMNELATILDELQESGKQMILLGERITAAVQAMALYLGEPEPPEPVHPQPAPKKARKAQSPEPPAEPPAPEPQIEQPVPITKEQMRAMLSGLASSGHRDEAKALVAKYGNGGSFSDIDPARYPELAEEVRKINA